MVSIILVTIRFSREINREGGVSPPQPPLPYYGRNKIICHWRKPGRFLILLIVKSEDLPYGVKYDLSEGEGMF